MRNRLVGYLIIAIALLMGYVIYSYDAAILSLAGSTCSLKGVFCPHEEVSRQLTQINMIILVLVAAIGIYLIFFSKEERIVTKIMRVKEQIQPKKITKANYHKIIESLNKDESSVLENIIDSQGSVMQSELADKTGMTKVKITRILDRLEGKGIIERKRRGMTNVVILKR